MLRWVIATELGSDSNIGLFIDAVERSGAEIFPVSLEEVLTPSYRPDIENDKPTIFYGPVNFITRMSALGYKPGVFGTPEGYSYGEMCRHLPHSMIFNNPSETLTGASKAILDILDDTKDYFFKPYLDNKTINGSVKSSHDIKKFLKLVDEGVVPDAPRDSLFIVSQPYGIEAEYRLFILNGKIITGSEYRPNISKEIPEKVIDFANTVIEQWCPEPIFVLDIAVSMGNCYVMEVQNFHSSGFYDSDIDLLVKSINERFK